MLLEIDAMLKKQLTKPVPLGDALAFAFSDNPDNKVKHNYSDAQVNYFPSAKMMMDVDPQQLLKTGTLRKDQLQWAVSRMEWTIPKQILTRSDLLVLQIINDNQWERPVYFAVTAGTGSYLGLEKYFALEGMGKLLQTIKIVQSHLNTNLDIEGVLLTMFDGRLRLSNQVVEEVKTHFQDMVFDTLIHRNIKLAEAPSFGKTIIMHDAIGKGSTSYLNLAREILQRNGLTKISDTDRIINIQESEEELSEDI